MGNVYLHRFESTRTLKQTRKTITFVGTDYELERSSVLIKITRKGSFDANRETLYAFSHLHRGLRYEHLAGILDLGITNQHLYCVREFFPSTSVDFKQKPILIGQLVSAVRILRCSQRPHGRIRPSNIFEQQSSLKLADPQIGTIRLSELTDEDVRFTAPEVLEGHPATLQGDLYSIGAILYRAFSGRDPFDDHNIENLRTKYLSASPKPLSRICYVSSPIGELVTALMEKDPRNRPSLEALLKIFPAPSPMALRAPCIGRDLQLRAARAFLRNSIGRRLRVLSIEGQPGIGKTRVVEELRSMSVLCGELFLSLPCSKGQGDMSQPLLDLVNSVLKNSAVVCKPDLRPYLQKLSSELSATSLSHPELDAQRLTYAVERTVNLFVTVLQTVGKQIPTTVVIEHVDYAHQFVSEIVKQLAFRAAETSLNLVLTRTTGQGDQQMYPMLAECLRDDFQRIVLPVLSAVEVKAMSGYLTSRQENDFSDVCPGNPLLIEETNRELMGLQTTSRVHEAVTSWVNKLSPDSMRLIELLAVLENQIEISVAQAFGDAMSIDFATGLEELKVSELVNVQDLTVGLIHSAIQKTIYSRIPIRHRISLHRLAYRTLSDRGADAKILAEHALLGRLYKEAAEHCADVAMDFVGKGRYVEAILFFTHANRCSKRIGIRLDSKNLLALAQSYARTGKLRQSREIHEQLLWEITSKKPEVREADRDLLAALYYGQADPAQQRSLQDQIELCRKAITAAPRGSERLHHLYLYIAQLHAQNGEPDDAQRALKCGENALQNYGREEDAVALLSVAHGYVLLHAGRFREAKEVCAGFKSQNSGLTVSALTNQACCYEHLGDLRLATELQISAKNAADQSGYAVAQVSAFVNLGAFETKRGNFADAWRSFRSAMDLLDSIRKRDHSFRQRTVFTLYTDMGVLSSEMGLYRKAIENVKLGRRCDSFLEFAGCAIAEAEIYTRVGDLAAAAGALRRLDHEKFRVPFLQVERLLVEARLNNTSHENRLRLIRKALAESERLGTLYQQCRALIELARVLGDLNRKNNALKVATHAVDLAERQNYQPLRVRALLAAGLVADPRPERENRFLAAFHGASELGIPEVIADSAFYLGREHIAAGHHVVAAEYLAKSISVTSQLSEGLPPRLRRLYTNEPRRKEAIELMEKCKQQLGHPLPEMLDLGQNKDASHSYFAALYRLTVLTHSARVAKPVLAAVLETLGGVIRRPCILAIDHGKGTEFHPIKTKVSEDLTTHLRSFGKKSRSRFYFKAAGEKDIRDPLAWVPIQSRHCTGGIYIVDQRNDPLTEQEMEFLTILGSVVSRAFDQVQIQEGQISQFHAIEQFHGLIGASKAMKEVYVQIQVASGNAATVLIEGESGTGKELVAKAVHQNGPRAKGPFIAVDCGAIPEGLIEAELFGAKRGSYTGAIADRAGLFEAAHQGTLFLDEISNTTLSIQAKLLRILQEREVRRLGETKGRPVDVRLIVATNCDLARLVHQGKFRQDLLYRLKVLHIKVPPLRNRREDIPMLAGAFLERLNNTNDAKKYFGPGVQDRLATHTYPGNVRELQNIIESAYFSSPSKVITTVPIQRDENQAALADEVQAWFKDLAEGRTDFWSGVHDRYKRRDISRERVLALIDFGLRSTRGSYKNMASMLRLKEKDYRRFMDFLRRNKCLLDFRPYRKAAAS